MVGMGLSIAGIKLNEKSIVKWCSTKNVNIVDKKAH